MSTLVEEQEAPTPNDRPAVWELVIADMQARDNVGRQRYRTPLQTFNGRDAMVDAYQEALDLVVYMRQVIEEKAAIVDRFDALVRTIEEFDEPNEKTRSVLRGIGLAMAAYQNTLILVGDHKGKEGVTAVRRLAALLELAKKHPGGELEHALEQARRDVP